MIRTGLGCEGVGEIGETEEFFFIMMIPTFLVILFFLCVHDGVSLNRIAKSSSTCSQDLKPVFFDKPVILWHLNLSAVMLFI